MNLAHPGKRGGDWGEVKANQKIMVICDRVDHGKGFKMLAFCFGSFVQKIMDLKIDFG